MFMPRFNSQNIFIRFIFSCYEYAFRLEIARLLDPIKPVFGIIIDGNVPFIVLSGLIGGLIIKKIPVIDFKKVISIFTGLGVLYIISGFISESGL